MTVEPPTPNESDENLLCQTSDAANGTPSAPGTEDTPGHVINYIQGLPWVDPAAFRDGSPIYNPGEVCTPTLIHVGENDERVPAAHSRALYRALRHYPKVPVELVVYPGEGHGLTKYKNRKAKMEWDLAWFERYLGSQAQVTKQEPATQ